MILPDELDAKAVLLLQSLCAPEGIHASSSTTANYRAIFARDAVMAGIAGLLLNDRVVSEGLVHTLEHLRELQGPEGQIASNFELRGTEPPHVSFGTLAPRIDAATWYLVGVALATRAKVLDPSMFRASVARVVHLLSALEYNGRHLMYIPPGGNWADEYIYEGYILYDQVLRAWGLRLLASIYGEPQWAAKSERIAQSIAERYGPIEDERAYPIASFSPLGVRNTFDLAACALLGVSGVAPELGRLSISWIDGHFLTHGALPPAFFPVIDEQHPEWPALRRYHLHAFRNLPHEYHNGGIWPIWLGWLGLAAVQCGRLDVLASLRKQLAAALRAHPHFAFEEFLHGKTGEPGGTPGMAYSATGLLFLAHADTEASRRLLWGA
ncbi:MAG: glycoside hydrolase 100 family protein [Gemmatimonadaceae bacterium]